MCMSAFSDGTLEYQAPARLVWRGAKDYGPPLASGPPCQWNWSRAMKKTDLEKSKGLKIQGQMRQAGVPGRFGQGAAQVPDRREQRKLDQAAGLVPFAAKLHADLVKQLQDLATAQGVSLNEVADRVIRAGLKQEKE